MDPANNARIQWMIGGLTFLYATAANRWRLAGWKGRSVTVLAVDAVQSKVSGNEMVSAKMVRPLLTRNPVVPLITAEGGKIVENVAETAIKGAITGAANAGKEFIEHLPEHATDSKKAWYWFQRKEGAKDPIIQYVKSFFSKTEDASSTKPLAITSGQETALPESPFAASLKANMATAVLGQATFLAGAYTYKNGVKTTKDKVIAATGLVSAAGFLTGIFAPQTLAKGVDTAWDACTRTVIPITLGTLAVSSLKKSHRERLSTQKGRSHATLGIGAMAGSIGSAILLNR